MSRRILLSCCALSLFIHSQANAITLQDYVAEVVETHPELQVRIQSWRQMIEDESLAKAGWRPSLDFAVSGGYYRTSSPQTGFETQSYDSQEASLTLTQNLFDGFETSNSVKQAKARIESEQLRVMDTADNLALEAASTYLAALKQKQLSQLAERNVHAHQQILEKIRQRSGYGVGRRSDEEQTEARLALAMSGLVAQQANLQDALTRLHYLLGRYVSADELQPLDEPLLADLVVPENDVNVLIDKALQQNPAVLSANTNVQATEYNYERAKSGYLPRVDLQLKSRHGRDLDGYDGRTHQNSAVLSLNYNLYGGGSDSAERRKRLSAVYEYRDYANTARRQAIESLRLAWMAARATEYQQQHLDSYVQRARTTRDLYMEEFYVGQRSLIDILDSEGELNSALVSQLGNRIDATTAELRLHEGTGELFEALKMDVAVNNGQIEVMNHPLTPANQLPYNTDADADGENEQTDHCDTTRQPAAVNDFGCIQSVDFKLPEVQQTVWVEQLNFVFDSAQLTAAAQRHLQEVIKQLRQQVGLAYIEVQAHTDSQGSDAYNLSLSQRRAEEIRRYLLDAGFEARRIKPIGVGEERPIASNDTEAGRAQNRRVEFHIFGWQE
ncbi:TolC family outer membrane protein [Oceanobacter mangrovi]|uniref:TolC family outer membrane protein n=1 Tax=Oceanobacter mangrovi TaxID=2862510 RepID=UPI001C8DA345|nr:TolC family outer membrane protein [Oceanobacter mangrovi]